ncbi:MAG: hypothetical protein ACO3C1_11655 [Ilumatobacteraceae bacterium]
MRRTIASLLFGTAYACASLTVSGFLLQRTALDPDHTADAVTAVLGDSAIQRELVDTITDAAVAQLANGDPAVEATLRANLQSVATLPEGQQLLAGVVHDAHAHLIGAQTEPVQITGPELVPLLRDERAAALPTITLPVPVVEPLSIARTTLRWMLPVVAVLTVVMVLLGFAAHPERSAVLRGLSVGLIMLAALTALLGYVLPKFAFPLFSDSAWARVPARLADDSVPVLVALELLMLGGAGALFAMAGMMRRRDRWRQPVSQRRFVEERRWSQ